MFTFLHAADIHLDSPLVGLERYEGAPVDDIRCATREALRNLVTLAISEKASFVLIAGDLYDGDWKDYHTGLFFADQMTRLRKADIRVFVAFGNHDAASRITRQLGNLPANVHHFSARRPETIHLDDIGAAIHGQSYAHPAVTEDLAASYPPALGDCINIGLLHTALTGREGHAVYAPCTVEGLVASNYDYWALGHVHHREVVRTDPWIVFPGNIQGRHIRESGAKGCTLVTVGDDRTIRAEHRDLDVLRWDTIRVDTADAPGPETAIDRFRDAIRKTLNDSGSDRPLAIRVILTGTTPAHTAFSMDPEKWTSEIRAACTDESGGRIWIEKILFQTAPPLNRDELARRNDPIGDLLRFIREIDRQLMDETGPSGDSLEILKILNADMVRLKAKLPGEIRNLDEAGDPGSPDHLKAMLDDIEQTLAARLLAREDTR